MLTKVNAPVSFNYNTTKIRGKQSVFLLTKTFFVHQNQLRYFEFGHCVIPVATFRRKIASVNGSLDSTSKGETILCDVTSPKEAQAHKAIGRCCCRLFCQQNFANVNRCSVY